jgi:ABC-type sugar transport system substrate-binding protein
MKVAKRLFVFAVSICLVLALVACNGDSSAPSGDSSVPSGEATGNNDDLVGDQVGYDYGLGKVAWDLDGLVDRIGRDKVAALRIGVSVNSGTDMWPRQWGEEWENLAKKYGFTANVLYNENDSVKEADTIATFVNQQMDAICISPIGETIAQPISEVYGKIPTVTCIPIPGGKVNVTVDTDQLAKGKMIADHVAEDANGAELTVLTVNNAMDLPHFNARINGFIQQSEELYPNINVIGNVLDTSVDG